MSKNFVRTEIEILRLVRSNTENYTNNHLYLFWHIHNSSVLLTPCYSYAVFYMLDATFGKFCLTCLELRSSFTACTINGIINVRSYFLH